MKTVIQISGLKFGYANHQNILDIAEFRIDCGDHVFLHGPSGSGKSTLLGLITGIIKARSGSIEVLGQKISEMSSRKRDKFRGDHLGYIFQMFNLLPYLSVVENILLPLDMSQYKKAKTTNIDATIESILSNLKIIDLINKPVTSLSIGQQQRVAVARSLIGKPELIIADEPTSSLDYDSREAFLKMLFDSANKSNSTIIFVSHDHSLKSFFSKTVSLAEINQTTGG